MLLAIKFQDLSFAQEQENLTLELNTLAIHWITKKVQESEITFNIKLPIDLMDRKVNILGRLWNFLRQLGLLGDSKLLFK